MATSSLTPGYLQPANPGEPPYSNALEDILHDVIVGLTGLDPTLVRPRVQPEPPNHPEFDENWIALGVSTQGTDWNHYQTYDEALDATIVEGSEILHATLSFYGPRYQELERIVRVGFQIEQNRTPLDAIKIKFKEVLDPVNLPALLKERWVKRLDVKIVFHRWTRRVYPIKSIHTAGGHLDNEHYLTPITPPSPTP